MLPLLVRGIRPLGANFVLMAILWRVEEEWMHPDFLRERDSGRTQKDGVEEHTINSEGEGREDGKMKSSMGDWI